MRKARGTICRVSVFHAIKGKGGGMHRRLVQGIIATVLMTLAVSAGP